MHDLAAIVNAVLAEYALPVRGVHGVVHWARVLDNGLRIADVEIAFERVWQEAPEVSRSFGVLAVADHNE